MKRHSATYLYIKLLLLILLPHAVKAQEASYTDSIRYVKVGGTGDGKSWAGAYGNLQTAINDLHDHLKEGTGRIYVAAGTYYPTETIEGVESNVDNTRFTSFKIYEGITIYGGFAADITDEPGATAESVLNLPNTRVMSDGTQTSTFAEWKNEKWNFAHETILSGEHSNAPTFNWNENEGTYKTNLGGSSYHVIWFATNGFITTGEEPNKITTNYAKPLNHIAELNGVTVKHGYANGAEGYAHTYKGGGVYMVSNSRLVNCIVTRCEANNRGGGIYMDGGGYVDNCFIHTNQTLGKETSEDDGTNSYGGGICVDYDGTVLRSIITNNVAQRGGGLAILHEKENYPLSNIGEANHKSFLSPSAAGCVVSNNTSTHEAGGVLLKEGGNINHMTITNNRCNGKNLIINGRRIGRSGGLYIDKCGVVFNSVCWGNSVDNNNIQYAAYTANSTAEASPWVYFSAFSRHDLTDWNGTVKDNVLSISPENSNTTVDGLYPEFVNPTGTAGVSITNEGKPTLCDWQPHAYSVLRGQGVKLIDFITVEDMLAAEIKQDMRGNTFAPRTTLGAYFPLKDKRSSAILPDVNGDGNLIKTLFVDPQRKYKATINIEDSFVGNSWDTPLGNLNDALNFIEEERKANSEGADGKWQIVVKEGEMTTAGNYVTGSLRSSSIIMQSNISIYGGYPEGLTGTDLSSGLLERNPVEYPTVLTGYITGHDYNRNAHHLVRFNEVSNAVLDGFKLYYGNAYTEDINAARSKHGAGVIVYSETEDVIMEGNVMRNCVVANCTGDEGAAVYVTGLNTEGEDYHVGFSMENCIIHNNKSNSSTTKSAIAAKGTYTTLNLNHCTIRGNIGYAIAGLESANVTVNNSIIHANASTEVTDISNLDISKVMTVSGNISGSYNLVDSSKDLPTGTNNWNSLTYSKGDKNYPHFVNPTNNIGVSTESDLTIYGGIPNFMPGNMSPVVNMANQADPDKYDISVITSRDYGGLPDIGAVECIELPAYGTVLYVTEYGSGTKDGSSWSNAIAGNTIYNINGTRITNNNGEDILTSDSRYCGSSGNYYYDRNNRPYAESSNHSKAFWTANPNRGTGANRNYRYISNTRQETYVSGLQYAVEKASSSNGVIKEVWVGNGIYTDWKGFVIRDKVSVYGGFPTSQGGTPGMNERKPLLSSSIPKSEANELLETQDYETIIQISSNSPTNNGTANFMSNTSNMRKYVLFQPDVCLTTLSPNSEWGNSDTRSNTYRYEDSDGVTIEDYKYVEYEGASWDGFTIRHGFINGLSNNRDGGAGVRMFRGVTLKNCIVKDNRYNGNRSRGGGIYCDDGDGNHSFVINCYVLNNYCTGNSDAYGGGMYMIVGTSYNSLFSNNYAQTEGGGIFLECATFYNNTIVNNSSNGTGGMHHWVDDNGRKSKLAVFNCLFYDNGNQAVGSENSNDLEYFYNCYVQTNTDLAQGIKNKIPTNITYNNLYGVGNQLANPFIDNGYPETLNFRLQKGSLCINAGWNEPAGYMLPDTDVDFTDRIQDCTVDIGAYEYNGAYDITPMLTNTDESTTATFFVTEEGRGNASAVSPAEAACVQKLQKVLDAAGRYKYNNPTHQVIVKLAGGFEAYEGYFPRRTTATMAGDINADNPRSLSLLVPRGIEVRGGYYDTYTSENEHGFLEVNRNIIDSKTTLTGKYTSNGQETNVYHVVTFTDNVYDGDGNLEYENGNPKTLMNSVTEENTSHYRSILDGLFITGGHADGLNPIDQYGGAARLPDFAHVRNCIVYGNEAAEGGGAFYMQPKSIVSGSVLEENTTEGYGGAVYIEEPIIPTEEIEPETAMETGPYSRIFSSTIVKNEAAHGGGIYFTTNLRANSVVLWHNTANQQSNIAGQIDPHSTEGEGNEIEQQPEDYPLAFSAVENLRVAGVGNISVDPDEAKGVRFYHTEHDPYYALQHFSVLNKSGMPDDSYNALAEQFQTTATDLAGVIRTGYNNGKIEIGARVYPGSLRENDYEHILTRIYVASASQQPNLADMKALQESGNDIYKQQGSSFAYPMSRLDDALEYVYNLRKKKPESGNMLFEIFVSGGEFYPLRTIDDSISYSRSNTFLVPEGVSIIGGMDPTIPYCQEKTGEEIIVNGVSLQPATTQEMRNARIHYDLNNNRIIEPWEFEQQTILSGQVINSEKSRSAYHVITCIASEGLIGALPNLGGYHVENEIATWYDQYNANDDNIDGEDNYTAYSGHNWEEDPEGFIATAGGTRSAQFGARILLDGLCINDGQAYEYQSDMIGSKYTYYKGGAICVDGNWVTKTINIDKTTDEYDALVAVGEAEYIYQTESNGEQSVTGIRLFNYVPNTITAVNNPRPIGFRNIPLTVMNCQFSNNSAGMGGAIFSNGELEIYGCSFTQNYSESGYDDRDNDKTKDFHYPGRGGAINVSNRLYMVNTLFANNEARKGAEDTYTHDSTGDCECGFGGAVVAGEHSRLHIANCNFVRNKARSYPAIFNYSSNKGWVVENADNSYTDYTPSSTPSDDEDTKNDGNSGAYRSAAVRANNPHRVVNSIFWGNEISEKDGTHMTMVFSPERDKEGNIVKDEQGNDKYVEQLWFCAYGEHCGLTPLMPNVEDPIDYRKMYFHFHEDIIHDKTYSRAAYIPALFKYNGGELSANSTRVYGDPNVTYNIILNAENEAHDGPNFINPTTIAGIDGHQANADWMMSRMNNLVDNGWSYLNQQITANLDGGYDCNFVNIDENGEVVTNGGSAGGGIYLTIADQTNKAHQIELKLEALPILIPYREEKFMYYPHIVDDETGEHEQILRISKDPNPSHNQAYIDIGVYEYQHVQLNPSGDEIDVLWVCETENQNNEVNDGSSWERATSDLQRAIETLLSSRNGHAKEIRMLEGKYTPIYNIANNLGFRISTTSLNNGIFYPKDGSEAQGVKSLTIRGGYSNSSEEKYDYAQYPSLLVASERNGISEEHLKHLFLIEDVRQWKTIRQSNNTLRHEETNEVIPITIEGVTFVNRKAGAHEEDGFTTHKNGGAALYYKRQAVEDGNESVALNPPSDGSRKLTLANCTFMLNGAETDVPAVTIGSGGGEALIYNSVFHSNTGTPLRAVDTKVVNSTFALNGGHAQLGNSEIPYTIGVEQKTFTSSLYNSVLWRNDRNIEGEKVDYSALVVDDRTYTFDDVKNNAISFLPEGIDKTNLPLSETNEDVIEGPNFRNPLLNATTDEEKGERDFSINPSVKLLSRADSILYKKSVYGVTDNSVKLSQVMDRGYNPRIFGGGLELGAYENMDKLLRVVYVDPNFAGSDGDGSSWNNSYGIGRLQNAIDAAAIYSASNNYKDAYVFVKGKRGNENLNEGITIRRGVNIYGSIRPGYANMVADETVLDDDTAPEDTQINLYQARIVAERPGMAGPSTIRTIVKEIKTDNNLYSTEQRSIVDGFQVTNPNPQAAPVVDFGNQNETLNHIVLRNSIVMGNTVTGEAVPVVNLSNGLLYNTLISDNNVSDTDGSVVSVSGQGRMINCTVVSGQTDVNAVTVDKTGNKVIASVTYNTADKTPAQETTEPDGSGGFTNCNALTGNPFVPYFQGDGTYQNYLPPHKKANSILTYQLHEESENIDKASDNAVSNGNVSLIPQGLASFINYDTDVDLLGNPRKLFGVVDRGCFETWNFNGEDIRTITIDDVTTTFKEVSDILYPTEGSVVYVQKNQSLVLNAEMTATFSPSYLLLRNGSSLYGQGANLKLDYVAVEKEFAGKYNLTSLPYIYNKVYTVTTDYEEGGLTETTSTANFYTYDGEKRATSGYSFAEENSACWIENDGTSDFVANQGFLIDRSEEIENLAPQSPLSSTFRFTGFSQEENSYIYTETSGESSKQVTLKQYNTTDNSKNPFEFTRSEDMGWNLVGMPYLVGNFDTGETTRTTIVDDGNGGTTTITTDTYGMNIPHLFYTLNNNGGYDTNQSWTTYGTDGTSITTSAGTLAMGEAFFTQTATLEDEEELTFLRPTYSDEITRTATRALLEVKNDAGADAIVLNPETEVGSITRSDTPVEYKQGSDGLKLRSLNHELPQVYVTTATGKRLSLLSSTPIGEEIDLGILIPHAGDVTFTLPCPEAFAEHEVVWLKDSRAGTIVNLLTDNYTLWTEESGLHEGYLTLQIGGPMPQLNLDGKTEQGNHIVFVHKGRLHIQRLTPGDEITVYTSDGRIIHRSTATESTHTLQVLPGLYLVKVNENRYKAL